MIYEYQCETCDRVIEFFRDLDERDDPVECPACGNQAQRRAFPSQVGTNTGKGGRIPGVCRSLPGEPVYVKNKRHWKELCKQRSTADRQIEPLGLL